MVDFVESDKMIKISGKVDKEQNFTKPVVSDLSTFPLIFFQNKNYQPVTLR